ncbi:hypothetical protein S1OALGB6SA_1170 [Olavius algarvensis spirochete endosymbiont]|nr:hypothetical protein S1OALGB6SA_1170 [Olavius algarvensis spirochete endosymbiont]
MKWVNLPLNILRDYNMGHFYSEAPGFALPMSWRSRPSRAALSLLKRVKSI